VEAGRIPDVRASEDVGIAVVGEVEMGQRIADKGVHSDLQQDDIPPLPALIEAKVGAS
jgi:hypothetical protein